MLRKVICVLVILSFFIGFVLIAGSLARPWPGIEAVQWDESSVRILPGYGTYEGLDSNNTQNDSQSSMGNEEVDQDKDGGSYLFHSENQGAIKEWSVFLYLRIKGIIRR